MTTKYGNTRIIDRGDEAWPEQSNASPCRIDGHPSVKTLTTNVGQWFACERCSTAWFKTYEEIRRSSEAQTAEGSK